MKWTTPKAMIGIGGTGTVLTALCCFTPVLVILLGTIGAGTAIAYLDIVLLPLLGLFILILVAGILRHLRCRTPGTE